MAFEDVDVADGALGFAVALHLHGQRGLDSQLGEELRVGADDLRGHAGLGCLVVVDGYDVT